MALRLLILLLFSFSISYSQNLSDTLLLDQVVVSENRIQATLKNSSRNISIINASELQNSPIRSLSEALSFEPGIDVRQRGVHGMQSDISIRGGTFEQSLILINGIKMTDPQTGHHSMNLPIPLFAVDRIEITKGAAASLYGQNAYSGAINIISLLPKERKFKGEISFGDFNLQHYSAFAAIPFGRLKQTIAINHSKSNGYRQNTDYQMSQIYYENEYQLTTQQTISSLLSYSNRKLGANGFYSNRFPEQFEAIETGIAALIYQYKTSKVKIKANFYGRQNYDEFLLIRNQPSFYRNRHTTKTIAGEFHLNMINRFGQSGFGLEWRSESITSSNLGNHTRVFNGAFVEHKYYNKRLDGRIGLYVNHYQSFGLKFFPGAELGYHISRHHKIYSSYGVSYRIPTYTELFYKDPTTIGNSQLKPEQAITYDLGYRYIKNGFKSELVAYRRNARNMIDYFRATSELPVNTNLWIPQNVLKVDFFGFESNNIVTFKNDSVKSGFNRVIFSWHFIEALISKDVDLETKYSLSSLRHQIIAGAEYKIAYRYFIHFKARYIMRFNLETYPLFDLKFTSKINKHFQGFVMISNLTNTQYIEAGYAIMPGRWLSCGLNYSL